MPLRYWILDENGTPQRAELLEWGEWFESDNRKKYHLTENIGDIYVSTVFLGLDHNFFEEGPPLIFETMIFGGEYDHYQERYSTWKEAIEGHARAVALADQGHANVQHAIETITQEGT